ncbi:MAG TPA: DNRLRE domain-containing protein [Opitutaceae bacterium]
MNASSLRRRRLPSALPFPAVILVLACCGFCPRLAADPIIVDNTDPGFTYTPTSAWTTSTSTSGYYGANYRIDTTTGADTGLAAKWTPAITVAGYYHVYLRWTAAPNRPAAAPLEIAWQGGAKLDATRTVDQQINGGQWVFLGTYYFSAGTGNYVKIRGTSPGQTVADAALFELSYATDTPPTYAAHAPAQGVNGTGSRVAITRDDAGNFSLSDAGTPFLVKGICAYQNLDLMAAAGANSFRTYSADVLANDPSILATARANNLKVLIGLNLRHESSSFTYWDNPDTVAQDIARFKAQIEQFKNEPALLGWAIGNEVDSLASATPVAIYEAIQAIARAAHEADPFHPTVAVHAGSSPTKIQNIRRYAPDIDIVACNSYRAFGNVHANVTGESTGGWKGGYLVTEFSIDQPSEATKTSWGAPLEPVSAEKATIIQDRYRQLVTDQPTPNRCLGTFYFAGQSTFRVSHSWYNMLMPNLAGTFAPTPIYDAMSEAWTGNAPATPAPQVQGLTLNGSGTEVTLPLGATVTAEATATSASSLTYTFELRREVPVSSNVQAPGTPIASGTSAQASFTLPADPATGFGNYRLYCYVEDTNGRVGTASLPFRIATAANANVSRVAITTEPINKAAKQGDSNIQFTVTATGSGPLSYQWLHLSRSLYGDYDYHAIPGATAASHTLSNVDVATHTGTYAVAVSDANGTRLSKDVTLQVLVQARIALQPVAVNAAVGEIATFSVGIDTAAPKVTYPLDYQWTHNGTDLSVASVPSAVARTLAFGPVQAADDGASFAVKITNSVATATHQITRTTTSDPATLTVLTQSLAPAADTTIRNGTYGDTNYGGTDVLTVRQLSTSTSDDRRAYLRFDLSALTAPVAKAVLYLYPKAITELTGASASHGVAQVAGDTWTETGLTWNNRGTYGPDYAAFATWTVSPTQIGEPIKIDVTSRLNNAIATDHQFSLRVFSLVDDGLVEYGAREADASFRPAIWVQP